MVKREQLTNEKLKGFFKNNFELTNYAIKLVRQTMREGQEMNIDLLLEQIQKEPHLFTKDEEESSEPRIK